MQTVFVKLGVIGDLIAVVVDIADHHAVVVEHLDVGVQTDLKFARSAVGLHPPLDAVAFGRIVDACDLRNQIVILQRLPYDCLPFGQQGVKVADDRLLDALLVQQRDVFVAAADGEKSPVSASVSSPASPAAFPLKDAPRKIPVSAAGGKNAASPSPEIMAAARPKAAPGNVS